MAFHGYIATEIATDCADGFITRREALRRLALLGLTATAASTLLAACSGGGSKSTTATTTATTAPPVSRPAAEMITVNGPNGKLKAAWAAATAAQPPGGPGVSPDIKGAVLIIHENSGLTPHFAILPARLAADGYSALCVDLLSEEGGTESLGDPAKAQAALAAAPRDRLVADLRAGIDELGRRTPGAKLGAMGFCFGGGLTWALLGAGEDRLAAAVPFYGPLPADPDFSKAKAAVLAIYAGNDTRVTPSQPAAVSALEKAGLTHETRVFPGVDHAFFNDTGPRYNAAAAGEAYRLVLDWFARYLK